MNRLINKLNRIIRRNAGFLLINISGLSVGLAVTIILLLFVANEVSFDRHFKNRDRIIRLNSIWVEEGNRSIEPICLRSAYTDLPDKVPGIEKAVQLYRGFDVEVQKDRERFAKVALIYADPSFIEVFSPVFITGSPVSFSGHPGEVILTDKAAVRLFGSTEVVGQTFKMDETLFTVRGVVKAFPGNTHFTFDVLAGMESVPDLADLGGLEFFTYYLLAPGISQKEVCDDINTLYAGQLKQRFSEFGGDFGSDTEKLTDIYLHSKTGFDIGKRGSMQTVYILSGLAILILLLAISNFVNLFVVQGDKRSFEVGIRKTNGGTIRDIAFQFFEEATVIVFMAFLLGVFLAIMLVRPFSLLIGKTVEMSLMSSPLFIGGLILLIIITITLSASYPAFYLSRFRPYDVLRRTKLPSKRRFTVAIVILQSVITIVLISSILIIRKQIDFLQNIPKGYDDEHVMILGGMNEKLASHYELMREELLKISNIEAVSAAQHTVGGGTSGQGIHVYGSADQTVKSINEYRIMPGLCELMKFKLVSGSFFSNNYQVNKKSVVLNESATKMLGIEQNPVGTQVVMFDEPLEIIGVVKDFYYESPSENIQPIALTAYAEKPYILYIRFNSALNKSKAGELILPVLRRYDPDFIMNPRWSDDIYASRFFKDRAVSKLLLVSTILSLFIALLGLFAIHSYSVSRRTKEIGIRKIHGGHPARITLLLSSEIFKLVLISGIIAIPLAWFITANWLKNYVNHIQMNILLLLAPLFMQLLFALMATIMVSIRISIKNPVDSLRFE